MRKNWMRRTAVMAAALVLLLSCVVSAAAAEFIPKVTVEQTDTKTIAVTVDESNDAILSQKKPTLSVACGFSCAYVTHGGSTVESTLKDGQVSFTVDAGGVYTIHALSGGSSSGSVGSTPLVESPKTGDVGVVCYAAMAALAAAGTVLHKSRKTKE